MPSPGECSLTTWSSQLPPLLLLFNCCVMSDSLQPHRLQPARLLCPWDSPGKKTRVACYFLLQGIFLTQGLNLNLLHWQMDSLSLSFTSAWALIPVCLVAVTKQGIASHWQPVRKRDLSPLAAGNWTRPATWTSSEVAASPEHAGKSPVAVRSPEILSRQPVKLTQASNYRNRR